MTINIVEQTTTRSIRIQSFFAGLITGMLTPNMIGNFIGRVYYFDRSKRTSIILLTLLSNYAQFLASLTFGWVAILIIGQLVVLDGSRPVEIWLGTGLLVAFLLYFFIDNFLYRIRKKGYFEDFRQRLQQHRTFRIRILGLSMLRFLVFTLQFSLVLNAFGEAISINSVLAIWQVYLLLMLIPSLFLGKVGIRESVALFVLSGIGMNEYAILFSSLIIWLINSLSPALLGFLICKRKSNVV